MRRATPECAYDRPVADEPTSDLPAARPAATVVVVRAAMDGLEVLLLQRSDVGPFGGMWVFPGGRVDDDDPGEDELERARHAAVREAAEEVGLSVSHESLVVWSHWTPPAIAPKRYTTWFFVAPWTGHDIAVDGHEIVDHRWLSPLDAIASGLPLAPPTIVTLHELHDAGSLDALRARQAPPAYVTRLARTADGRSVLLWHGDIGYESGDPDLIGPRHRLWMPPDASPTYERTDS
jgi:8-oxo-dGTP pyrophosphatase MutT (NUDIX family)